ncbi:metallophosphoesterase family protein [Modestobacter italicus]|uniref:metallophosphoesterase family protein n=1 Tax=Modestobacter italicus (strain DSM 44449 / CECT 9708 / BC 501) TaxID=2732864 RepID=UPI001C94BDE0|nr:metallophosphoesterase [Modestobacter italicus]
MSWNRDDATQLPLPFPPSRRDRAEHVARQVGGAAARVLRFLVRWVLRIALPVLSGAAALQAFPYHATVQGVPFEVQGSLFSRPGLSADTTLGSWEFPEVSNVPFGVHISPEDVDVLQLARLAGGDVPTFVQQLQAEITAMIPEIARWLIAELLIGVAVGLLAAAAINMSIRYLRGLPRRPRELRLRALQAATAALVTVAVAGYGVLTYNPNWVLESRLTGTLAAAQLFPSELSDYYSQQSKAFDVLGSVLGIQAALQAQIEDDQTPETAFRVMTISDMHLAANYPLVGQYATNYDVDLIINAGDESAFGTRQELTPAYLDAVAAVTTTTPMLWVAGNHDSPATAEIMATVPGVTVLGTKTRTDDGYDVTAGVVEAYGLTIAGLSDPRVYGAEGAYGADAKDVVEPLQREAVRQALGVEGADVAELADQAGGAVQAADASTSSAAPVDGSATPPVDGSATPPADGTAATPPADGTAATSPADSAATPPANGTGAAADVDPTEDLETVDVFAVHEPVAAEELHEVLPDRIRATVSGHVHAQNATADIQGDGTEIDLVEGSTGAGGLDNIVRGEERPPIEFSILSVAGDCQFTRVIRFSIEPGVTSLVEGPSPTSPQAFGDDVTASTVYFRPQDVADDRTCGTELGISEQEPWPRDELAEED